MSDACGALFKPLYFLSLSVPGRNGMHLVLQGKVEKRYLADDARFIVNSTIVRYQVLV